MEVFDFGIRLQELRSKKKLSQAEVADMLEVHHSTISSYERNTITPSLDILIKLARIYGASLDYIVGFTNRSNIYIDDLLPDEQRTVLDMIERLILHFKNKTGN